MLFWYDGKTKDVGISRLLQAHPSQHLLLSAWFLNDLILLDPRLSFAGQQRKVPSLPRKHNPNVPKAPNVVVYMRTHWHECPNYNHHFPHILLTQTSNPLKNISSFPKYVGAFTLIETQTILSLSHKNCTWNALLRAPCSLSKSADLCQTSWLVLGQLASPLGNDKNFALPMGGAQQRMVMEWQGLPYSRVTWNPKCRV